MELLSHKLKHLKYQNKNYLIRHFSYEKSANFPWSIDSFWRNVAIPNRLGKCFPAVYEQGLLPFLTLRYTISKTILFAVIISTLKSCNEPIFHYFLDF